MVDVFVKNASLICAPQETVGLQELVEQQQRDLAYTKEKVGPAKFRFKNPYQEELASFFLEADDAIITENNDVEIFVDGQEKFDRLKEDIKKRQNIIFTYFITSSTKMKLAKKSCNS